MNDENQQMMSANTIIIEEYLESYTPTTEQGGVIIQTTADIISALSDMADVEADEVNTILMRLGFRPGRNASGSFGWLMRLRND